MLAHRPGIILGPGAAAGDTDLLLVVDEAVTSKFVVPYRWHQIDANIIESEDVAVKTANAVYFPW